MVTIITRRVFFIKAKPARRSNTPPFLRDTASPGSTGWPVKPLSLGEGAHGVPKPWWRNPLLVSATAFGLAAAVGIGAVIAVDPKALVMTPNEPITLRPIPSSPSAHPETSYDGATTSADGNAYANRPPPTDQSFLATPFAHRSAASPPTSRTAPLARRNGPPADRVPMKCVVTRPGAEEIGKCLDRYANR